MIRRRFFLITASSLLLSACGGNLLGLGPQEAGTIYPIWPPFPPGNGVTGSGAQNANTVRGMFGRGA